MKYTGVSAVNNLNLLQIIVGQEKIQGYLKSDNMDGLMNELQQYLSEDEFNELNNLMQNSLTTVYKKYVKKDTTELEVPIESEKRIKELLIQLCRNMKQENLAEILNNSFLVTNNVEDYNICYFDHKLRLSYDICIGDEAADAFEIDPFSMKKEMFIKREELLGMDNDSFVLFQKEQEKKEIEKKIEEKNKSVKEINAKDIVKVSSELLVKGSGGSILCDEMEMVNNQLINKKEGEKQYG